MEPPQVSTWSTPPKGGEEPTTGRPAPPSSDPASEDISAPEGSWLLRSGSGAAMTIGSGVGSAADAISGAAAAVSNFPFFASAALASSSWKKEKNWAGVKVLTSYVGIK